MSEAAAPSSLPDGSAQMGIRKDWPELATILDKVLDTIAKSERLQIFAKWINTEPGQIRQRKLDLSEAEKAWLAKHPEIRLGVDPKWPPFEFIDAAGIYSGISSGYVRLLNDKLNKNE